MISQKSTDNLKKIFKEEYKTDLTDEEARQTGQKLVEYFSLLIEMDRKVKIVRKNEK